MVRFKYEKFNTFNYAKVKEDLQKNFEESSPSPWPLDVDVWSLIDSDTCYIEDGDEIVGYCLFRVLDHHHYQKKVGLSEVLYVRPEYRGKVSIMFLRYIEKTAKELGAKGFFQSSSALKDISKLMSREGYQAAETTYFKEL